MNNRLQWLIVQFTRRLWFRAGLYGVVAVATALIGAMTSRFIPSEMANIVGADAVEGILKILASSMLAVATFSLGIMVAAFSAAASNATPRASRLLIQDPTSQNALATFVGAFIFSLIGIIALGTGYYGPGGRFVLFVATILVIFLVIATFFQWIDYLSHLGRMGEIIDKVEAATAKAMRARCQVPYLGGNRLERAKKNGFPLEIESIGYIQHLDVASLQSIAERANGDIQVLRLPGSFADNNSPLMLTSWAPDEEQSKELRKAFAIGSERSFDQDPRFGLIALSEIASRALSPGINDPGTAIGVIGRIVKVMKIWSDALDENKEHDIRYPNVQVPSVEVKDLFDDAFSPIARDAAGNLEVGVRLQKAFKSLAVRGGKAFADNARQHSKLALKRSEIALNLPEDKKILAALAAGVGQKETKNQRPRTNSKT